MAFEPHPWFIGLAGVEHSAETARMLAWAATQGSSGVIKPGDLFVHEQDVPDGSVAIDPGGFVVESKFSGASMQSYVERAPTLTTLEVPATGSSGGVVRYVVAQIIDPDYPGNGPAPEIPNEGEYARPYLATSLSASRTEIPLAKIDQPANTGTITNDMITDLREVANPRRLERQFARPRVTSDGGPQEFLKARMATGGEYFPGGGGESNTFTVDFPVWATMMIINAGWLQVREDGNKSSWGNFWIEYGTEYRDHTWPDGRQWEFSTQKFQWDISEKSSVGRAPWMMADTKSVIPAKLRGKTVTFAFKAGVSDSASAVTGAVKMDAASGLMCNLTFLEAPVGDWEAAN